MAMKLYLAKGKHTGFERVLQAKRKDVAEGCVADNVRDGIYPADEYTVVLIAKE